MKTQLAASLESIDFQRNSTLIKDMALFINAAMKKGTVAAATAIEGDLSRIAQKVTGINYRIRMIKGDGLNAFVVPPQADVANPMNPGALATKVKRLGRTPSEQELFKGTVDIKNGTVSGIYSEIPIDIFIASEFITMNLGPKFTGEHLAAIIAHEMGHGFTYLRYLGKMTIANFAVAEIARRIHEGEPDKSVQEIVRVTETKTGWRLRDLGVINAGTDPLVVQQIVFAGMIESIRSELGTKFYDRRAFEFASDQFVARHGGAHLIVEGLDVMYRSGVPFIKEYRTTYGNIMASLSGYLHLLAGASLTVLGFIGLSMGLAQGVALIVFGPLLIIGTLLTGLDDGIYDPIMKRYEAMRREVIASSKAPGLSVAQRTTILRQLEAIDDVLGKMNGKFYFGPDVITEWLVGVFTGRPAEQKFQRKLEELTNNRLFELSNTLQTKVV